MNAVYLFLILVMAAFIVYVLYLNNKKNEDTLDYISQLLKKGDDGKLYKTMDYMDKGGYISENRNNGGCEKGCNKGCDKGCDIEEKIVYYYPQYPNPWLMNRYDNYDYAGGYNLYSYGDPYRRRRHNNYNDNEDNNKNTVKNTISINNTYPPPKQSSNNSNDYILIEPNNTPTKAPDNNDKKASLKNDKNK